MPKGKHKITKEKARKYAKDFDKKKKEHPGELKGVPEGFLFEAADIKLLMSAPETKYFLIRFGWKKTELSEGIEKEMITPILMVLNEKMEIINPDSGLGIETRAIRSAQAMDNEEGGGFLDEATPIPPPNIPAIDL